jgi:hypothetical protein
MTWTFEFAEAWAKVANGEKEKFTHPLWNWDCGFKLDLDGPIVSLESRFYPPARNGTGLWNGGMRLRLLDEIVDQVEISAATLDELKVKADAQILKFVEDLKAHYNGGKA